MTDNGEASAPIVMYTTAWCVDCWRAKQVMDSMQVEYTEIDIAEDPDAVELVMQLNRGNRSVPTIIFPDGTVMTEPRTTALVEKLASLV
ncbi:MAG: glutaredoxin family protein [Caldilineaceae bacterium]|nr:glutaredoxin family protein [Caldilineaceae bacterium]